MKIKRTVVITQFIILIILLALVGCARDESEDEISLSNNENVDSTQDENKEQMDDIESPKVKEVEALEIPENMLAYWMVLHNKKPLVSANEDCQEFYWDEFFWHTSELMLEFNTHDFSIVDLDNDGSEEMVLTGYLPETTQVLDYQEGKVYSYQFAFRGMKGITVNGVYNSSSAADIGGFHRIHFDKGVYEVETLAYMEHDYFEVEGGEVSGEEFFAYTKSLAKAEQIEDMDFTEEMLNKILLGDLGEEELSIVRHVEREEICDENNPLMADVPEIYLAVLTGNKEFICATERGEQFIVERNCVKNPEGEKLYQILYFSMVDMEGDGEDEVVLSCVDADDDYGAENLILHAAEGRIYGYVFDVWDEMDDITEDGVFRGEYDYENYEERYWKISSFEKTGYRMEQVEGYESGSCNKITYYFFSEEAIAGWLE